jgi:hypothetical protein
MVKTLMLVVLGLAFTTSLFSANASDQRVNSGGFTCLIRDLGCKGIYCCAQAMCSNKRVNSGWVKQCWEVQIPLVPL